MTYTLPSDVARCDGLIQQYKEFCSMRKTCQRWISGQNNLAEHNVNRLVWMPAVRYCDKYRGAK